MKIFLRTSLAAAAMAAALAPRAAWAQSEMYPQHFDLEEVRLLDSPLKTAMERNNRLLLEYDVNRLLTPFVREAGLSDKAGSEYAGWVARYPSFGNWGQPDWSLEGHVGGHYLTALALAHAATDDAEMRAALGARLDEMLAVLKDCQQAYDGSTDGMEGFIGGQPITQIWRGLYAGDLTAFRRYGGWVPFYCQHKVLAGLRDAWLYAGREEAKEMYRKMCDWSVNVVSNLTDDQMQQVLGWEHGGMNEPLADAYRLFGEKKYLDAAKRYSHRQMLDGMQTLNTSFLDGKHANTQVPKYIGFERVYQEDGSAAYRTAAHNFWTDVAEHRTVCIGGNSVAEHFLAASRCAEYMNNLEGPESCNSNNMLKLSELLFDETHDARYADFYEATMWNHILSTQDPETGGYVYFTTLRPQGYRIYSQVNQGMWCCVGTGMENHAKYGHFIYTHSTDDKTLYVNLYTASTLSSPKFALTQATDFPYAETSTITIDRDGDFALALRHPHWTTRDFAVAVNGQPVAAAATEGEASYVRVERAWKKGDVVTVTLPMTLRYEACPNYEDYIAFKYGPLLLAAQTTAVSADEAAGTGLAYEALQNEYGGEGRMDHSPGARGKALPLSAAPLLIGDRAKVLERITPEGNLRFRIDASSEQGKGEWGDLTLVPFYAIHHARYQCYWYQQTAENYAQSDMGKADAAEAALKARTLDYVATGEQQSEAGHAMQASSDSNKGSYNGEFYRDAQSGGWFSYTLQNPDGETDGLAVMCRFTTADKNRVGSIYIDGVKLADVTIPASHPKAESTGFYNEEFAIPADMMRDADGHAKRQVVFRFVASGATPIPGLYYLRLVSGYESHDYEFVASEWVTGDASRVAQENISYDGENGLTVAAAGNNNVCLTLDCNRCEYYVAGAQKYLVVKGSGLSRGSGKSFLWWLNGVNKGSSVSPTRTVIAADGETVVAWDITASGLDGNCRGERWYACTGHTIFGLTATTGAARISYIGFQSSVDDFLAAVGLHDLPKADRADSPARCYTPDGVRHARPVRGVNIVDGKKVLI